MGGSKHFTMIYSGFKLKLALQEKLRLATEIANSRKC